MNMKQILVVGIAVTALAVPALADGSGGSMSGALSGAMSGSTDDGATSMEGGGSGGAASVTFDVQQQLAAKGYTNITPMGGPGTTRFRANNPDGKKSS